MLELKRSDGITERVYMLEIYQLVQRNMGYIRSLNRSEADEIAARIITHAVQHRNHEMTGTLNAYVRSLASSFSKEIQARKNAMCAIDDVVPSNSHISDREMVWVSHEVSYDIVGRKNVTNVLKLQYLLTPAKVVDYCMAILQAVDINTDLCTEVPTLQEESEIRYGKSWSNTEGTIKRYTPATILQGVLDAVQAITRQQRLRQKDVTWYRVCNAIPSDVGILGTITDKPTVALLQSTQDNNKFYGINRYTMEMCAIDDGEQLHMDYVDWVPVTDSGTRTVYAVDISPLYNYVYSQIVVPQTQDTQLKRFLGKEHNAKYLPSGKVLLNATDENYFIELKMELVTLLLSIGVAEILGVTDDNIYIRPARRLSYSTLRYVLFNGKQIDLPIRVVPLNTQQKKKVAKLAI